MKYKKLNQIKQIIIIAISNKYKITKVNKNISNKKSKLV